MNSVNYDEPDESDMDESAIELSEEFIADDDLHVLGEGSDTEQTQVLPELKLTRISEPVLPLKVNMARQISEYFTGARWPSTEQMTKPINYVLQPDGLWEIRNVQAGWLVRRRDKFVNPLPGFVEEEHVDYGIPKYGKIPPELYWQIVSFFKDICSDSGDEVYVQTMWDPDENKYFNHVPKQVVSGASVRYERDQALEDRCPLVVETHSHNKMSAFFSGTDNSDEKSDRFFGVLGKLNTQNPEVLYSFLCGGVRTNIPVSDIFALGHPNTFPSGWKDQVTHQSALVQSQFGSYRMAGQGNQGQVRQQGWQGIGTGSQLGSSSRQWQNQARTKEKEAEATIEAAAAFAEAQIEGALDDESFLEQSDVTGEVARTPFFQMSSINSLEEDSTLSDCVQTILVELSNRTTDGQWTLKMTDLELEEMFEKMVNALDDHTAGVLAGVLADCGYGEHLLEALEEEPEEEENLVS